MYLQRRLQRLLDDLGAGRVVLEDAVARRVQPHLDAVRHLPDGSIDLDSCTPELRSFARAYFLTIAATEDAPAPFASSPPLPVSPHEVVRQNRELLARFERVFHAFAGTPPEAFTRDGEDFSDAVRRLGALMASNKRLAAKRFQAANDALNALIEYYKATSLDRLGAVRTTAGGRMVMGGTSRFTSSALAAARSMLLYTDTLLIPDPVAPWLEVARDEERFSNVQIFEQIYYLSQLRPLVDAELPYPPILVFPSLEKLLENHDPKTQDAQEQMFLQVFSHCFGRTFDALAEVFSFARTEPSLLASKVDEHRLMFAPGASGRELFGEAMDIYRDYVRKMRSPEYVAPMLSKSDAELSVIAITERLSAQFHIRDNSDYLTAAPLMSQPAHWHYYRLLRRIEAESLVKQKIVQPTTSALAQAIAAPANSWLGNVPIAQIVELRARLENETFRRKLDGYMKELAGASEADLDATVATVARALSSMLAEHRVEVQRIVDDYQRRHAQTAVGTWISFAASFLPWFPVAAPAMALGATTKYVAEKVTEQIQLSKHRRTLLGCLAAAANERRR